MANAAERLTKPFEGLESLLDGATAGVLPLGAGGGGEGGQQLYTAASAGANATVTGGSKSTTVNINLGKMVENIVFNGGLRENAQDLERQVTEIMYRVLAMAATV